MRRVCCVCKVEYGRIDCGPENEDLISHGYCKECSKKEEERIMKELEELKTKTEYSKL